MNVTLPEDLASIVRLQVESGRYASSAEVMRHALEALAFREEEDAAELADLRAAWDEGIASGDAGPLDLEAFKAEARARLAAER